MCRITSARTQEFEATDGFAQNVIDITESVCREATGEPQVIPVNERISAVASAMAVAIAQVAVTCTGTGTAELSIEGAANAEAMAVAIGNATSRIVASSGVCGLCESVVDSFATSIETVSVTAVAQLIVNETLQFNNEPLTETFVERVVAMNAVEALSTIVGEFRTSAIDGCSADFIINATVNGTTAQCETSISADDIKTEIDNIANSNLEVRALSCEGDGMTATANISVSEVANAVAQAVTAADTFCVSFGPGNGTMACALTNGSVEAIATARASAVASALAEAVGTECGCSLRSNVTIDEVRDIMANSSSRAFANVCVNGSSSAFASDFQIEVASSLAEALSEVFITATSGDECDIQLNAIAEVNITEA